MSKIKYKTRKVIDCFDWDKLVIETYGKPYCFQQQDGCQGRGTFTLTIPEEYPEDCGNDSIPEIVNGDKMGVKFDAWLARDPKQPIPEQEFEWELGLFWERNFYPNIQMVANDLYKKRLIKAGEYDIKIDW